MVYRKLALAGAFECLSMSYGFAMQQPVATIYGLVQNEQNIVITAQSQPSTPTAMSPADLGSIESTTSCPTPRAEFKGGGQRTSLVLCPDLQKLDDSTTASQKSDRSVSTASLHTVGLGSGPNSQRSGRHSDRTATISDRSHQSAGETTALFASVNSSNTTPLMSDSSLAIHRPWTTWIKPVVFYCLLTAVGLVHGGINKHLSGDAPNKHFYVAPWVEWESGAVANILAGLVLAVGYKLFHVLEPMRSKERTWVGYPLMAATLSIGQMIGESIPLPENSNWRNLAVNVWVAPLAAWYSGHLLWYVCARNRQLHPQFRAPETPEQIPGVSAEEIAVDEL